MLRHAGILQKRRPGSYCSERRLFSASIRSGPSLMGLALSTYELTRRFGKVFARIAFLILRTGSSVAATARRQTFMLSRNSALLPVLRMRSSRPLVLA